MRLILVLNTFIILFCILTLLSIFIYYNEDEYHFDIMFILALMSVVVIVYCLKLFTIVL